MKIETFKQAQRLITAKRNLEIQMESVEKSSLQQEYVNGIIPTYKSMIAELQKQFDELKDEEDKE